MKDKEIPALLRVKLWLGLQSEEAEWHKCQTEGELAVFAETVSSKSNPVLNTQNEIFVGHDIDSVFLV